MQQAKTNNMRGSTRQIRMKASTEKEHTTTIGTANVSWK